MKLEDFKIEGDKITDSQLDALYIYLSMTYNTMKDDEKEMWYNIMKQIDTEFYDQD